MGIGEEWEGVASNGPELKKRDAFAGGELELSCGEGIAGRVEFRSAGGRRPWSQIQIAVAPMVPDTSTTTATSEAYTSAAPKAIGSQRHA